MGTMVHSLQRGMQDLYHQPQDPPPNPYKPEAKRGLNPMQRSGRFFFWASLVCDAAYKKYLGSALEGLQAAVFNPGANSELLQGAV